MCPCSPPPICLAPSSCATSCVSMETLSAKVLSSGGGGVTGGGGVGVGVSVLEGGEGSGSKTGLGGDA